jgi:hypothetical protein
MNPPEFHCRAIAIAATAWLASCGSGQERVGAEGAEGGTSSGATSSGGANDSGPKGLPSVDGGRGGSSGGAGDASGSTEVDGSVEDSSGGCGAGTTSWTASAPGGELILLASGQSYPFSIVVDAANAYWTNDQAGVMKVPVGGGAVSSLIAGRSGAGIAIDSTNVYWTQTFVCPPGNTCPPYSGEIQSSPLGPGTPTTLAVSYTQSYFVAVDATSVYSSSPIGLQKVAIDGGTPVSLWSTPMPATSSDMIGVPYVIAVANGRLYAAFNPSSSTGGTPAGSIQFIPVGGGNPVTIYSAQNAWITSIAVDSTNIYWTNYGSMEPNNTNGVVMRMPLGGGTATTIASGQHDPAAIAVDGTNVYWGNAGTQSAGYLDGSIMKAPLDGGTPVTLATGGGGVYGIAVDATSVYWTTQNDSVTGYTCRGKIVKLTPK